MWTLDVIQESFEDVSLDYNSKKTHRSIHSLKRQNTVNNRTRSMNSLVNSNYSNASLGTNSSKELLLTPSQKLKMIKKQRIERSADHLLSNSPENLNSIDFLSDDVLPDDLIVFDVPSLHSLNSLSTIKGRKPSLRRKNTVSSNSSGESATITNTHNISQQIESDVPNVSSHVPRHVFTSNSNSSSGMSSPATRASSIFSKSSDISEFICFQDETISPLSHEVKLLNDHRDVKLEETLQRMTILKNLTHVDSNEPNHKYISSTRQSNLPPKSKSETLKHEKDYRSIVESEILHEKKKLKRYQENKKQIVERNQKDERLWNQVMENYHTLIKLPQTRELWWRYVSSKHRTSIWEKQFISEKKKVYEANVFKDLLDRSTDIIEAACNFKSLKAEITKCRLYSEDSNLVESVELIETLSEQIQFAFPELGLFQIGETFDSVLKILLSFNELKAKNNKLISVETIKLVNLVCVIFYVMNDEVKTMKCLVSLILRKLPHSMLISTSDDIPDLLSEELLIEKNSRSEYLKDINDQFSKYLLQVNPNLYNHFVFKDINILRIVQGLTAYFFSNQLPIDIVIRILDIYSFEGDIMLLRTSLALLKKIFFKLYGDKDDIFSVLNFDHVRKTIEVGEVEEFVSDIRNILKKNG